MSKTSTIIPMTQLTGNLSTNQLRRISKRGTITVTVARKVRPGAETRVLAWGDRVVAALKNFEGCLGAAVLDSGEAREFHMVFRFVDGYTLRNWERSPERILLLEEIESDIEEERVTSVAGEDVYLSSLAGAKPRRPLVLRVLIDAVWIFPVALLWSYVISPWFNDLPSAAKVLASASVITLIAEVALVPFRQKLRSKRGLPLDKSVGRNA
jgi:antibiotic biosynthesis monooxygenase (ABM) superfamily enzyme